MPPVRKEILDQIREDVLPNGVRVFYLLLFNHIGDEIEVYGLETSKGYILADGGEFFRELGLSGLEITPIQQGLIETFCQDHQMWIEDEEIQKKIDPTMVREEAYRFGLELLKLDGLIRG